MLSNLNFIKSKKTIILLLVELLLFSIGIAGLLQKTGVVIDVKQTEEIMNEGISLPAGAYKATIWYKTNSDIEKKINFTIDGIVQYKKLLSNPVNLLKDANYNTCHFYLMSSTDSLRAEIINYGDESLIIDGIQIENTNAGSRIFIFWILLLSFIINGIVLISVLYQKGKISNEQLLVVLGVPALVVTASLPCFVDYILAGSECIYHISRIEHFTNQIINGEIHCDIFLIIPVLLRLLGMDITMAYRLFIIAVNLITAIVANYSFNRCFNNKLVGMMGCTLYIMAPYRISSIYERSAVEEFSMLIFLPLITLVFYKILKLCLILWKKSFCIKSFLELIKYIIIAVLVNIWFIVPNKSFISLTSVLTIFIVFLVCVAGYYGLQCNWKVIPAKYLLAIICAISILVGNYQLNSILFENEGYLKIYSSESIDISTIMGDGYIPVEADK